MTYLLDVRSWKLDVESLTVKIFRESTDAPIIGGLTSNLEHPTPNNYIILSHYQFFSR